MEELGLALEDFGKAIRLDPQNARYYYDRAWAPCHHDPNLRPEEALPDLEEAIRLDPAAKWFRGGARLHPVLSGCWADAAEDFACQDIRHSDRYWPDGGADEVVWLTLPGCSRARKRTAEGRLSITSNGIEPSPGY